MPLLIVFSPLFSFLSVLCFGRYLGKAGSALLTTSSLFIAFFCSLYNFYQILISGSVIVYSFFPWFSSGFFLVNWEFLFDPLSVLMLSMVSLISALVHVYSIEYMSHDPHFSRFMSYLSLFTFFMFLLVTA